MPMLCIEAYDKPAPNPTNVKLSPFFIMPFSKASSRASPIEAPEVFQVYLNSCKTYLLDNSFFSFAELYSIICLMWHY